MPDDGSDEPKYNTLLQSIKSVAFDGTYCSYLIIQKCVPVPGIKPPFPQPASPLVTRVREEKFCQFSCTVCLGKKSCSTSFDGDEGNSHHLPSNDWTTMSNVLERIGKKTVVASFTTLTSHFPGGNKDTHDEVSLLYLWRKNR